MTVADAAKYLNRSEAMIRKLVAQKRLGSDKMLGRLLVSKKALDSYKRSKPRPGRPRSEPECPHCHRILGTRRELTVHVARCTKNKKRRPSRPCAHCGKTYIVGSGLQRHEAACDAKPKVRPKNRKGRRK